MSAAGCASASSKRDPVSTLLAAAEALRSAARGIEGLELDGADARSDLRALIGNIRHGAFLAITLAAIELRSAVAARQVTVSALNRRIATK